MDTPEDEKDKIPAEEEIHPDTEKAADSDPAPQPKSVLEPTSPVVRKTVSGRKRAVLVGFIVVMLLGGVAAAYILKGRQSADSAQPGQNSQQNKDWQVPAYAAAEYSDSQYGRIIGIEVDGKTALARHFYDWNVFHAEGDWLYFYSVDPTSRPAEDDLDSRMTYAFHAFNYQTKQYKDLGQAQAPDFGSGLADIYAMDGHIYFWLSGYRTDGATYRCVFSESDACIGLELFLGEYGRVHKGAGQYYVFDDFGDAGVSSQTVYTYDPAAKTKRKLAEVGSEFGVGTIALGVDSKDRVWFAEYGGDKGDGDPQGSNPEFERLYALDKNGRTVVTYRANQLPLDSTHAYWRWQDGKIILQQGDERQVSFDPGKEEFGSSGPVQNLDGEGKLGDYLNVFRRDLHIPSFYEFNHRPDPDKDPGEPDYPEE
jgi:hypothetical protein